MHFVYIVRCADGTLYTGCAKDLDARVSAHNGARGAKYTRSRRPVTLVYKERCSSLGKALRREHEIKQLTREEKKMLVGSGAPRRRAGAQAALPPPVMRARTASTTRSQRGR